MLVNFDHDDVRGKFKIEIRAELFTCAIANICIALVVQEVVFGQIRFQEVCHHAFYLSSLNRRIWVAIRAQSTVLTHLE